MYRVQISAFKIAWPDACACCSRAADTYIGVESTRVTGVRVVREQTKTWDVPYCRRCLDHIEAARELDAFSSRVVHPTVLVTLGLLLVTGAALLTLYSVGSRHVIFAAVVFGIITGAVVALTFQWCHQYYLRAVARKRRELAELSDAFDSLLRKSCGSEDALAVEYGGWQGTVHTFYFASQEFAAAFVRSNPGKCLDRGEMHD